MSIAVRYFSRSGNTKKVADAIARAAGVQAQSTDTPLDAPVDLLFLGGAVYAGGIDGALRGFIETLTPQQVGRVALFGTAAARDTGCAQMQKALEARGIAVMKEHFYCPGRFTLVHRGRPNADDLQAAAAFAVRTMQKGAGK